jgi:phosphoenolpyruvate carboxykinase (diphosphate)
LYIMAQGEYEGVGLEDARFRALFQRDVVLESAWYQERLRCKQARDVSLWQRHLAALEQFQSPGITTVPANVGFDLQDRVRLAREQHARVSSPTYLGELRGTIGADPFSGQITR